MTDKEKLISIFNNQMTNAGWNKEEFKESINSDGDVSITSNEFTFVFDKDTEQFKGAFNWKW